MLWISFAIIAFKYMRHAIHEPDIWWHLANGRAMLESRTLLRHDIFSHTLFGTSWINFEWLSQVLLYWILKYSGMKGLFGWKVAMGLGSVVWLGWTAFKAGARGPLLFLLTWVGTHLYQVRLCARVELFTLNLLPLFVLMFLTARDTSSTTLRKATPWILFGLMVLWCNLHAGFIYGAGLSVLFSIGARWEKMDRHVVSFFDKCTVLLLAASLINPFGPKLVEVFIQVASDFKNSPGLLSEWNAPSVRDTPYFWGVFVLCGSVLINGLLRQHRGARFWGPALLAFMLYGARYYRSTALLAAVAVPFLAEAWAGRGTGRGGSSFSEKKWMFITASLWALSLTALFVDKDFLIHRLPPGIVDWNVFPAGSCRFVDKQNISGRLHNPLGFGGYIAWALGPERQIFMDGRYIFYPLIVEEQDLLSGKKFPIDEKSWGDFFGKYGVDYAIERYEPLRLLRQEGEPPFTKSILNVMFPPKTWALVYWDDASLVFVKRLPERAILIREHEYRILHPYNAEQTLYLAKLGENNRGMLIGELERHQNEVGPSNRAEWIRSLLGQQGNRKIN